MARALDRTTDVLQRARRRLEPPGPEPAVAGWPEPPGPEPAVACCLEPPEIEPAGGGDGGDGGDGGGGGGGGGGYGELWKPGDETEAMGLILNNTDPEVFEASGRENAEYLSQFFAKGDTVLDLGCGIGRVARYVAPRCELLWAVDASEEMLTMARRRLGDRPNVRYERCLDNAVPGVPDASVDLAYSVLVLQHLEREDAFQLLRDLRRMVRPGGVAWLTFPNLLSDEYLSAFLAYVDQGQTANRSRARFYTPQEVERLLPAAGFEVEELDAGVEIKVVAR